MKLLIDENLPKRLKFDFPEYEVYTVRDKNWNGKNNGELLNLMIKNGFEVLLTFDKNLQYQQNFKKYPILVIIFNAADNSYSTIAPLVIKVKSILSKDFKIGPIEVAS